VKALDGAPAKAADRPANVGILVQPAQAQIKREVRSLPSGMTPVRSAPNTVCSELVVCCGPQVCTERA